MFVGQYNGLYHPDPRGQGAACNETYFVVEDTDNSKNWGKFNKIYEFFGYILNIFFKFMNLDKSVEPGYSILYIFSKLLFLILVILFVYFIIKLKNMFFIFKINKYVTTKKK